MRAINRIIIVRWFHRPTEPLLVTTTVALQLVLTLLTVGLGIGIPPDKVGWHFIVVVEVAIGSVVTMYGSYAVATGRTRQLAVLRAFGARRSLVLKLLAWEMGMLAMGGTFVGLGFSVVTETLVNRYTGARYMGSSEA